MYTTSREATEARDLLGKEVSLEKEAEKQREQTEKRLIQLESNLRNKETVLQQVSKELDDAKQRVDQLEKQKEGIQKEANTIARDISDDTKCLQSLVSAITSHRKNASIAKETVVLKESIASEKRKLLNPIHHPVVASRLGAITK